MRLAGEAITHLAKGTWEQFKKQNRLTKYYDKGEVKQQQQKFK